MTAGGGGMPDCESPYFWHIGYAVGFERVPVQRL